MKIVADINMPALEETFGRHGELLKVAGRNLCRSELADADILLVRSVTQVNADLLAGTRVAFVGSATIGIDHLDTGWLQDNGIIWAHAPGCNANAAAQYALAMMWLACDRLQQPFFQQSVGIVGRGNVGRRLEQLLRVLGIPVQACDPPLQEQGTTGLVSMDEACANSIISLHVPLTTTGRYPSKHLLGPERLAALRPGTLLVNTSRGGVIEASALLTHLRSGHLQAALDVWPDEPLIAPELLAAVTVGSPHIAGYSSEGKRAGTEMIYQAFCKALNIKPAGPPPGSLSQPSSSFASSSTTHQVLERLLHASCPVARDDAALRALPRLPGANGCIQFDKLRATYPQRHEFKAHHVRGVDTGTAKLLKHMGFVVS